jgi:hypothetical protein
MKDARVVVLGLAPGNIPDRIASVLQEKGASVYGLRAEDVDFGDTFRVSELMHDIEPDMVILPKGQLASMINIRTVSGAARSFIAQYCGVEESEVPEDAVYQLVDAFMPSIRIMVDRHSLRGSMWMESGWRGALYEARKKLGRLWLSWWNGDKTDTDSAADLLNFVGFFIRAVMYKPVEEEWGEWGKSS